MVSNKTLIVGCGINYAFNRAFKKENSFLGSNFSYKEILPKMFNDRNEAWELKSKLKIYLNNNKNDLEEFLRYDFAGATGTLCENEKEEIKKEFIRILGMNHRDIPFRLAIQDSDFSYFKENLKAFNCIYTTNFDLKLYYLMAKLKLFDRFKDGFCEKLTCEGLNIHLFNAGLISWSLVYLHGSMHLLSHPETDFDALKIAKVQSGKLIEKREKLCSSMFHDLFVIGGTTEEKLNIIKNNTYLKNALKSLKNIEGDLVIYGCSIDDNDAHIWKNICDSRTNNIYIGISKDCSDKNIDRIKDHFKNKNTTFYCHDNNIWEDGWINKVTDTQ